MTAAGTPPLASTGTSPATLFDVVAGSGAATIAVIGLVKNAGKTTVVNALMDNVPLRFGLTSLGLDGERTDHLTGLDKPRIVPPRGTLIATTVGSLDRSHYTMERVEALPFHTSLGGVVIGRAVGDRAVEISGPTTLAEVASTAARLHGHGADLVLVDGAINRLGSASPRVSDALIMATGGLVADTLDETVETTLSTLEMLSLPELDAPTRALVSDEALADARAVTVSAAGEIATLDLTTVVGEGVRVARDVEARATATLFLGGALTQEFADDFLRTLPPKRRVTLVVRDATVLICTPATVSRLRRRGIDLRVLRPLQVLAVTTNPYRFPQPYNARVFFDAVAAAIGDRAPVFDVVHGLSAVPAGAASSFPPEPRTV
ncbi:MAG TPA: hypothetical protein VL117_04910 [Thermoleophilia bacterium]|nr:hypothetical protein [Thermoleophilia bacterium]